MKLKSKFDNSKLKSTDNNPYELISNLEGPIIQMTKFEMKGSIMDKEFKIHVINNLSDEYVVVLDDLENCLTSTGLTIENICEKFNHWHRWIKNENEEKKQQKY